MFRQRRGVLATTASMCNPSSTCPYLNTLLYDRPNMVIYRVSKAAVDFNHVLIWDVSSYIEFVSLLNFGEPWPPKARVQQRGNPPPCLTQSHQPQLSKHLSDKTQASTHKDSLQD